MFSNKSLGAKFRADGWSPKKPILIIPGLCSSCLKVVESPHNDWVGKRIWLSMSSIGFDKVWDTMPLFSRKKKKSSLASSVDREMADVDDNEKRRWISHMVLKEDGVSDPDGIKLRPVKGIKGCAYLDPGAITNSLSYVFGPFAEMLQDAGYIEEINLNAVPYDWRLPPHRLEERDGYFSDVQHIIETMVKQNGAKVVVVAHSLGNRVMHYFCRFMEKKLGRQWMSDHVDTWVALGPLWLGSPKLLRAMVTGDRMGLEAFLFPEEGIMLGRSLGSSAWMFPYVTHEHEFQTYCQVLNKKTKKRENKTNQQILCESGAEIVWNKFVKYYDEHDLVGPQSEVLKAPPVDRLYAIYGINLKTETYFFFKKAKSSKSATDYVLDSSGSIPNLKCEGGVGYETKETKQNVLKGKQRSGDGTVPYASLAYCKKWSKEIDVKVAEIDGAEHREILKNKTMWQLVLEHAMQAPRPTSLPPTFLDVTFDVKLKIKTKFVDRTLTMTRSCFVTAKSNKTTSRLLYDHVSDISLDENLQGFQIEFVNITLPYIFKSNQSEDIVNELAARCRYVKDIKSTYKEDRDEYGRTDLHKAVLSNSTELMMDLIKTGSDVNAVDTNGYTPLMTAADKGFLNAMLICLQARDVDLKKNTNSNTSVMHKMVSISMEECTASKLQQWCGVMKTLKRAGCSLNDKAEMGETPLHMAVKRNNQIAIQWLGENGANVNAKNAMDETPLHYAVRTGKESTVETLLKLGASCHVNSMQNETPLAMAKKTNQSIFSLMNTFHGGATGQGEFKSSEAAVPTDCDEYGQTALHRAAFDDRLDTVFEILMDKSAADQIHTSDKNGWTPIHSAAANGNLDTLLVLLNVHGVNTNSQTHNGTTVLHYLMRKRFHVSRSDTYIDVLNKLKDKGVQLNLLAKRQISPLHEAALHGNIEGARWILINGAKVNPTTDAGETPLHFAVRSTSAAMVNLLLEYDADTNIASKLEGTPLELARVIRDVELIGILEPVSNKPRRARRSCKEVDRRTSLFQMTSSKKHLLQKLPDTVEVEEEYEEKFELEEEEEEGCEEEVYMAEATESVPAGGMRYRRSSIVGDAPPPSLVRARAPSFSVFSADTYVPQRPAVAANPPVSAAAAAPPRQRTTASGMPRISVRGTPPASGGRSLASSGGPARGRGMQPSPQRGRGGVPRGRGGRGRGMASPVPGQRGRGAPRARGIPRGRGMASPARGNVAGPGTLNAPRSTPSSPNHQQARKLVGQRPSLQKPAAPLPPPE